MADRTAEATPRQIGRRRLLEKPRRLDRSQQTLAILLSKDCLAALGRPTESHVGVIQRVQAIREIMHPVHPTFQIPLRIQHSFLRNEAVKADRREDLARVLLCKSVGETARGK